MLFGIKDELFSLIIQGPWIKRKVCIRLTFTFNFGESLACLEANFECFSLLAWKMADKSRSHPCNAECTLNEKDWQIKGEGGCFKRRTCSKTRWSSADNVTQLFLSFESIDDVSRSDLRSEKDSCNCFDSDFVRIYTVGFLSLGLLCIDDHDWSWDLISYAISSCERHKQLITKLIFSWEASLAWIIIITKHPRNYHGRSFVHVCRLPAHNNSVIKTDLHSYIISA